jgi:tripartite-type tricarboxylate transporter receptor subunit TctC
MRRAFEIIAAALLAVASVSVTAQAQTFPSRPIRVVIGYPPGGGIDVTGRLIAERLGQQLGQPAIVENKPGAGGQIGADAVSKARPDGHTLLFAVGSDLTWMKFMTRRKTVDPLVELTPIATVLASVSGIAVNANSPYKTLKELVDYAQKNPGKLTYGTAGVQSAYYLYGEMLKLNGLSMTHVPYTGTPPILTALFANEIDVGALTIAIATPSVQGGKIRMLGVFDPTRFPGTPDVPAIREVLPGFNAPVSWFGFFGPAGLADDLAGRLNAEIAKAVQSPDLDEKIRGQSQRPMITPYPKMRPFVAETTEIFRNIFGAAHIQPLD